MKLNLECACEASMLAIACETLPDRVCLVPEKREEVTTEGGLDIVGNFDRVSDSVKQLHDAGIFVSLFIDPDESQIAASKKLNVEAVELHTGTYANAATDADQSRELIVLENAGQHVLEHQLILHAGHGLNYLNVTDVADIEGMEELNIGHSIISRAVFVGLEEAVSEMKQLCIR